MIHTRPGEKKAGVSATSPGSELCGRSLPFLRLLIPPCMKDVQLSRLSCSFKGVKSPQLRDAHFLPGEWWLSSWGRLTPWMEASMMLVKAKRLWIRTIPRHGHQPSGRPQDALNLLLHKLGRTECCEREAGGPWECEVTTPKLILPQHPAGEKQKDLVKKGKWALRSLQHLPPLLSTLSKLVFLLRPNSHSIFSQSRGHSDPYNSQVRSRHPCAPNPSKAPKTRTVCYVFFYQTWK